MDAVILPAKFLSATQSEGAVHFIPYASETAIIKARATLSSHMISLITEGEKIMYVENETIRLTPQTIMVMKAGNILFTERPSERLLIKSTMIFFDDQVVKEAMELNGCKNSDGADTTQRHLFDRDAYLRSFVETVNGLQDKKLLNAAMQRIKVYEILLYLESKSPGTLAQLCTPAPLHTDEQRIRQVMDTHINELLSVQELAFLCHMSLSTFKRKFQQLYVQTPARWLQIQRLRMAAHQLRARGTRPGSLYVDAGYQNHSSFSKAFKEYFGVLPKDYANMDF